MQHGADDDHVQLLAWSGQFHDGLGNPALQLVALFGRAYVFVVLQVVAHGQVWPVGTMTTAPYSFPSTKDFDHAPVLGDDLADLPGTALASRLGEVHGQARITLQLGLDRLQHHGGLLESVHDDDRIPLALGDDTPQDEYLAGDRRFRFAAWSGHYVRLRLG
ncbi:hypothetical protein D3C71_1237440 [compost metagenome]